MAKLLAILIICFYGATTDARLERRDVCSFFEPLENFNPSRFSGGWYVAETYLSIPSELDNLCTHERFILQNDGTYEIIRNSLFASDGNRKRAKFTTILPYPADEPARFRLKQHGRDYELYDEYVVDTDYDSYAISYKCAISLVRTSGRIIDLMTRAQIPLESTLTQMKEFLRQYNLNTWTFIKFNQTNCDNITQSV